MRLRVALCAAVLLAPLVATLPGGGPAGAAGARIVYTYEVRGLGNSSSLAVFATQAAETYADSRGWGLGGSIAFRRAASGGNFTLWLAAAGRVPGFGAPCDSGYSCTQGRNVIINETRWLTATPMWTANHRSLRDYRHMVVNHETGHWLGFGHAFCGGAGQLAPLMQQQSISLQGCRPNPWPLPSERQRLASSRGVPIISGSPVGVLEAVVAGLGSLRVRGWTIDPNTSAPGRVHVYVDGRGWALTAGAYRADVARRHPGYGPNHGFAVSLPAAPGTHRVCVYSMNVAGPGGATTLGCRVVSVSGSPRGHVDSVVVVGTALQVVGWVIDPDALGPARVHVYVDSSGVSSTADLPRDDVARAYPRYGSQHGFSVLAPAIPGEHRVCAYGINVAGSGRNVNLGCVTVTVPT